MKNNKLLVILVFLVPLLSGCFMQVDGDTKNNKESFFNAKIVWESDSFEVIHHKYITIEGSAVYVLGAAGTSEEEILVKLDANTGSVLWRTEPFMEVNQKAPIVVGDYAYVFIGSNLIYSYSIQTGELSAIIETYTESNGFKIGWSAITFGNYLYFGIYGESENYLARVDTTNIDYNKNLSEPQQIIPEVVWTPKSGNPIWAEPIIRDNIIYCLTFASYYDDLIELAGINMETKNEVFHKWIDYDKGREDYPLFIHEDMIYILSGSISAYNLNTGEQIFKKIFSDDTPDEEWYNASASLGAKYHNEKIYYTNSVSRTKPEDSYRNIICIDSKTGKLVWSDVPPVSQSLGTNPIIVSDRMYIPHFYGLRVYNTDTGKLIGVDTSFCGAGRGRNILFNDYMITVRRDRNTGSGTLVAVDVDG